MRYSAIVHPYSSDFRSLHYEKKKKSLSYSTVLGSTVWSYELLLSHTTMALIRTVHGQRIPRRNRTQPRIHVACRCLHSRFEQPSGKEVRFYVVAVDEIRKKSSKKNRNRSKMTKPCFEHSEHSSVFYQRFIALWSQLLGARNLSIAKPRAEVFIFLSFFCAG